jgi:hypothetical protein
VRSGRRLVRGGASVKKGRRALVSRAFGRPPAGPRSSG